jgi:PAS domain S-box-containing protein
VKKLTTTVSYSKDGELSRLVQQLHDAEAHLQEFMGGQADTPDPLKQTVLLRKVQEKLLQNEDSLRRVTETQKTILDALQAHIALLDASGTILFVNEAWRRFSIGNSLQDPEYKVGGNYIELCEQTEGDCAESARRIADGIRAVLRRELPQFTLQYPSHLPTEKRWYRAMVFPLASPATSGAVVMHANVTAIVLAETASQQSETRYREATKQLSAALHAMQMVMDYSLDAICTIDSEGLFRQVSAGCEKIWGYSSEELIGTPYTAKVLPEDLARTNQMTTDIMAGHPTSDFQNRYIRKDGSVVDIMWSANWSEQDQSMFCVARNVTESRKALEALRRNETMLKEAERIAQFGSWELDLAHPGDFNANPLHWSDEVFRIFGHEPRAVEVSYDSFLSAVHPEDRELVGEAFTAAIRTKTKYALDHRIKLPDGTIRYVHAEARIFTHENSDRLLKAVGIVQDITERRLKEEALRDSEERFTSAFEFASIGMGLVALDGTWLKVNPALCRLLGYSEEELVNKTFQEMTHPDDLEADMKSVRRLVSGEVRHYNLEKRYFHKDGHIVWILLSVSLVHDVHGQPLYFFSQVQDITQSKLDEEALRGSEERYRFLFFDNPHPMWVFDRKTLKFLAVNLAAVEQYGYSEAEFLSMTVRDIRPPEDVPLFEAALNSLPEARGRQRSESRHRKKSGKIINVEVAADTIVFDGHAARLVAVTDLTERKNFELKLAEQASLIDEARDAIVQRDLEEKILFWNKGAERLYGWTAAEAIGRKITDITYRNTEVYAAARTELMAKGEWSGELEHTTKSGKSVIVEARWTLLRDSDSQPKSILVINSDVTERKQLEAQFLRAQRMESIGTLAGGIAHDLNNMLAPILMSAHLLKHMGVAGKPLELVENIETSAKRGSDLVKQVLSFARGLAGARVSVHLGDVAQEVASIIKNTFPKNITLTLDIEPDIWLLTSDPTQLNQALLNLCVNARDAMPDGGSLTLSARNTVVDERLASTHPGMHPGRYLLVTVTDSGCGIPKEQLSRIFDPFYTTKELGKGTGLGLSTVLGIIRSHEGFVNVQSEVGRGTTFTLYLPAQNEVKEADSREEGEDDLPRGNGEWVLVVDDELPILTITRQILEAFGYNVLTAENGAIAVGLLARNIDKISLVLIDMMMPVMDGPATITALHQLNATVKIIAASGLASRGGVEKARQAGVTHFLTKPYPASALLKMLRLCLAKRSR